MRRRGLAREGESLLRRNSGHWYSAREMAVAMINERTRDGDVEHLTNLVASTMAKVRKARPKWLEVRRRPRRLEYRHTANSARMKCADCGKNRPLTTMRRRTDDGESELVSLCRDCLCRDEMPIYVNPFTKCPLGWGPS
jgi:hypothetical protein